MIEKMMRIGRLYDFYGALLTEHQRKCIEQHYLQDLSLGEIAEDCGVSRQAINDILRRSEDLLEQYETKLGLALHEQKRMEQLLAVRALLAEAVEKDPPDYELARRALDNIDNILK